MNLRAVHTGRGLTNVSTMDKEIWGEFGRYPDQVKVTARKIRELILDPPEPADDDPEDEFPEGRLLTRKHRTRERNRNIRKKLLKVRREKGPLHCEICGFKPSVTDEKLEDAFFEAHHVVPLSQSDASPTKLKDMALLCANCHRLIHRAISIEKRWFSISDVKTMLL